MTLLALFGAESAIMLVLARLPPLSPTAAALLDPLLLSIVVLPVLHLALLRPLVREMERNQHAMQALELQALTDPLTGLPNRVAFVEAIRKEVQHAAAIVGAFSVIVFDVRRLGEVNGALGHESGDLLLKLMAERLRGNTATFGTVARLGSDVFGVLLDGVDVARASEVADRLHQLVEVPFSLGDAPFELEAHAGYASYPQHGDTPNVLLQRAELALQRAKRLGERDSAYREENEAQARRRLQMVRLLRKGIERGELSLVYQPKVSLDAGQFVGVEALVRWNEPELGPVSPAEFVPLAEQTNLIRPLTLWVLEEAIRQIAAWKSAGLDVSVSVNLSARNLVDESLPDRVEELLARWTVSAASLSFEVTESAMLADPDRAARVLERIRVLGIALSIDDFGTGFSSLTYVRTMPASELKIDRSFVQNIESNDGDAAIVRAVIALAHSLGMKVVCEGVETEGALVRLRELGCDLAQGFHVSRPLAAPALVAFVRASLLQPFAPKHARLSVAPPSSRLPPFSRPPLRESLRAMRLGSTPWPASRKGT